MNMTTSYREIIGNKYNLAPKQLIVLDIPNKNIKTVREILSTNLKYTDNGCEIGSINYLTKSSHYFIRAKALQEKSFIPFFNMESIVPMRPQVFKNYNLKEGDLIISKDSNIGEAIILDKDYPNHMISNALYRLPINKYKYYLFAFLKHPYFKKQLDLLVPKGSTIRHAKTLFLDCKIPFPNQKNSEKLIQYVELLIQSIVNKEKELMLKSEEIFNLIEEELNTNQSSNNFSFKEPSFQEISRCGRLDTGMYNKKFKQIKFLISNYKFGKSTLKDLGFQITRGQNLQISNIGRSIYSEYQAKNYYKLLLSKNFTEYMTVSKDLYLGNKKSLKIIKKGDIIFSCRGDLGRVIVFCEDVNNTITNIDNVHITNAKASMEKNIFIGTFLNYLRKKGLLSSISITGSGADSFTKYQFNLLEFPNFPDEKVKQISKKYYNPFEYPKNINFENFLDKDNEWNTNIGIVELDKSIKEIKKHLNIILDKIIKNEEFSNFFLIDL